MLALAGGAGALAFVAAIAIGWVALGPRDDAARAIVAAPREQAPPAAPTAIRVTPASIAAVSGAQALVDASPRAADAPDAAPSVAAATTRETPRPAWDPRARGSTREQQDRLDALQRLCDQGTVTAAECAAKRGAILRGDP